MRNVLGLIWHARGDRYEDIAALRDMLKASEAKSLAQATRIAVMEQHLADLDAYLKSSVILRKV